MNLRAENVAIVYMIIILTTLQDLRWRHFHRADFSSRTTQLVTAHILGSRSHAKNKCNLMWPHKLQSAKYISICLSLHLYAFYLSMCLSHLPVCLSIHLYAFYLSIRLPVCLIYLSVSLSALSIYRPIYLSVSLSALSIYRSIYLSVCLPICLSIYLSVSIYLYPSIRLSVLSIYVYLSIYKAVYLGFPKSRHSLSNSRNFSLFMQPELELWCS
jgi:hypothetical protein